MDEFYPSPYLRAEDIDGPVAVTIESVRAEKFSGQRGEPDVLKPVTFFRELKKGLIVNRTNYRSIMEITGQEDTDDWAGARLLLRVEQVPAFGEVVDALRVRPIPKSKRPRIEDDPPEWVTDHR